MEKALSKMTLAEAGRKFLYSGALTSLVVWGLGQMQDRNDDLRRASTAIQLIQQDSQSLRKIAEELQVEVRYLRQRLDSLPGAAK